MNSLPTRLQALRDSVAGRPAIKAVATSDIPADLLQPAVQAELITVTNTIPADAVASRIAEQSSELLFTGASTLYDLSDTLHHPDSRIVAKGERLNQISVIDVAAYRSLMIVGNGFGWDSPLLTDKLKTAGHLIRVARAVGLEQPKIAVLAAVEVVYPQMEVTCDGAVLAKMSDRGQIKNGLVDGPLSYDVAVDPDVARGKGVTNSTVAGQAEGFLAPTPQTARGIHESLVKYAGAGAGSLIIGAPCPIVPVGVLDHPQSLIISAVLAHLLGTKG